MTVDPVPVVVSKRDCFCWVALGIGYLSVFERSESLEPNGIAQRYSVAKVLVREPDMSSVVPWANADR